jgi:hypothetical protein
MGVLELRRQLNLPFEPLHVDTGSHIGRQDLDHDLAAEPHFVRQENTAHPSTTELALDAVGATDNGFQTVTQIGQGEPLDGCFWGSIS